MDEMDLAVMAVLDPAARRTWDLRISCTCSSKHCKRFHGLPYPTAEFISLIGKTDAHNLERAKLYDRYETAQSGVERMEAFHDLTKPFNGYC